MKNELIQYRHETQQELENILAYWMQYTIDEKHGGFIGKIDNDNNIDAEAPKGAVLNSRILWSFSAAYNLTAKKEYLQIAERAFQYIADHFIDKEFGGVYWTVDHKGNPLDTKKQVYALAFAVYSLSEYYQSSKNEAAKKLAIELYETIVDHSYDAVHGGYIEALTRDWQETDDLKLSAKDANEKKTMNTHLHVLEAFANLYRSWPDEVLKQRIVELIHIFRDHIISGKNNHLVLFSDEQWNERSALISYGHDIEAAWLLQDAAELAGEELLLKNVKKTSLQLTIAAAKGLDGDGGLWYEYDPQNNHLIRQKHAWPQAEAMVGFFNAWQLSGNDKYLKQSIKSWQFINEYMIDKKGGEWYWGVQQDRSPMPHQDKVGLWKCPYHNSRACMEIIKRIHSILNKERSNEPEIFHC